MDLLSLLIEVLPMRYICAGSFMTIFAMMYALVSA